MVVDSGSVSPQERLAQRETKNNRKKEDLQYVTRTSFLSSKSR